MKSGNDSKNVVSWEKPMNGWIKANFDGAAKGNPSPSGSGVILRDHIGNTFSLATKKLEDGTNNLAEDKATLLAVKLAK